MSKQSMREEAERLIRETMEKRNLVIKQGNTRIEAVCGKCGAPNRLSAERGASPGQVSPARIAVTSRRRCRRSFFVIASIVGWAERSEPTMPSGDGGHGASAPLPTLNPFQPGLLERFTDA